ncbi:MAG: uroporphyrinogen-III synthase, partial [Betaproteobacteria bacterium]|nr:uroporphyrinogen-III synthase [Betaproteobacteria bacterium]
ARALQSRGVTGVITPLPDSARIDSEALLATPFLREVAGQHVVIFRGDGGRELLGDTLRARGARVQTVTCYRRGKPTFDAALLNAAGARGEVAAVIVTSSEGLRNFRERLGAGGGWLDHALVAVPHPRIAAVARELGLTRVVESASGDEALAATVLRAFAA